MGTRWARKATAHAGASSTSPTKVTRARSSRWRTSRRPAVASLIRSGRPPSTGTAAIPSGASGRREPRQGQRHARAVRVVVDAPRVTLRIDGRWRRPWRCWRSFVVGAALLVAGCSSTTISSVSAASTGARANTPPGSTAGVSALKPIDQAALQATVDLTAKELLVPGAVVILRTPRGEFTVAYGTTRLGASAS